MTPTIIPGRPTSAIVVTSAIDMAMQDPVDGEAFTRDVFKALDRFSQKDWGDLCEDDTKLNNQSLETNLRILAAYKASDQPIWIIADAYNGPTTVLFPSDY